MSIRAIAWAAETDLMGPTKWVLMALANYANDEDGTCWPGQEKIAAFAGVSERTVRQHLVKLEEDGYIRRRERRRQDGTRTSDEYRLLFGRAVAEPAAEAVPVPESEPAAEPSTGGSRRLQQPAAGAGTTGGSRRAIGTTFLEPSVEPSVARERPKRMPRKAPETPLPEGWAPNGDHAALARERRVDLTEQAARFRDWALARDARFVRWDAAFSNWLRRAEPVLTAAVGANGMPGLWGRE